MSSAVRAARIEFGRIIRDARIKKGLGQDYLGAELGHSSGQMISNIERGLAVPPRKHIARLAVILDIDSSRLIDCFLEIEKSRLHQTG